ncbi:MAG TPA: Smr/MutS family protein [Bacteroidaceae bacterium]|nr:Smr/MutS family protein [Bacteroidaceae bacterium]
MVYPDNFEHKIGFKDLRLRLNELCVCSLGQQKVEEICFMTNYEDVNRRLDQVVEFVNILQSEDGFPDSDFFDTRNSLNRVKVVGMYMDEQELLCLLKSLITINNIIGFLNREESALLYPRLKSLAGNVTLFPELIKNIDRILTKHGKIKDNASPELYRIRMDLAATTFSISRILNSILKESQRDGIIEKEVSPTIRDGRLVLPVIPAFKRKIKGIVHDESASGKTVFIEPEQAVEANNHIRELEMEEKREVMRILIEVANKIRGMIPDLLNSFEFLSEIDFIRAKAKLAIEQSAIKPMLENSTLIDWVEAVHPLLRLSLAKHGREVVPLSIELNNENRILLISGPNAGGKSVCLKSVGLLQYMLQCGMLVPMRENSHVGLFETIFIDIGDEQSIEDDLSTYSSHLNNLKQMMRHSNKRSLILIDEFGSGTEPGIGGAIAEAVLKRFLKNGSFGVITTHYQNLKQYADANKGIVNGAMMYDRHLMQPLYQLQIGNPGSSFAVEIARKIGLPEDVINDAAEIVGKDYINSDKYLQDIVRDKRYWENKRENIHRLEKRLKVEAAKHQKDVEELIKERKKILKEAKDRSENIFRESNAVIENTIKKIKESQAEKEQTKMARQELLEFKNNLAHAINSDQEEIIKQQMERVLRRQQRGKKQKSDRLRERENRELTSPTKTVKQGVKKGVETFKVGDTVRIIGQTVVGDIESIDKKGITIVFGNISTTVKRDRVEFAMKSKKNDLDKTTTFLSSETQKNIYDKKIKFKPDIDVRGERGEEALQTIMYFIDDAVILGMSRVRILHGTGNGILRGLIREYLNTLPGVASFKDEHIQMGGSGITVVDLK